MQLGERKKNTRAHAHQHAHSHAHARPPAHARTHTHSLTHTHTHTSDKTNGTTQQKDKQRNNFFQSSRIVWQKKIKLTPNFAAIVTAHGKTKAYLHRSKIIVSRLSMQQRRTNSGTPTLWLQWTKEGERWTYKKHIKPRQVAGEQKCPSEQTHKTLHAVY